MDRLEEAEARERLDPRTERLLEDRDWIEAPLHHGGERAVQGPYPGEVALRRRDPQLLEEPLVEAEGALLGLPAVPARWQ